MIAPIIMKATKNINKPIKTHFWVAMLLNECPLVRPHNFLALTNSKSILMSIDFEFIRARKSNIWYIKLVRTHEQGSTEGRFLELGQTY